MLFNPQSLAEAFAVGELELAGGELLVVSEGLVETG